MKTLFFLIVLIPFTSIACDNRFIGLDDSNCGIYFTGDWEVVDGYHIALTTDLPSMEGYLHPQEDGLYDIYEEQEHLSLLNRTKVLYTLEVGEGYLAETDQRFPSKAPLFRVPLKKGETIKIKLEVLPSNIEEGGVIVFDKLKLVKVIK